MEFREISRDNRQILSKARSEEILAKAPHGVLAVPGWQLDELKDK